jgi:hypothetical protein
MLAYISFGARKSRRCMYRISSACHRADLDCFTLLSINLANGISQDVCVELKMWIEVIILYFLVGLLSQHCWRD